MLFLGRASPEMFPRACNAACGCQFLSKKKKITSEAIIADVSHSTIHLPVKWKLELHP